MSDAFYYEKMETWSIASTGAWEGKDLSSAPFNIPASAVAEISIVTTHVGTSCSGGIRASGSSLERIFYLHEAEDFDGVDAVTMFVQTNALSAIECYASHPGYIEFYLLGYWINSTYVEKFQSFKAGTESGWVGHDISSYGVPSGNIAEIVLANRSTSGEHTVGVRQSGTNIHRVVELHEAEGAAGISGQADFATMLTNSDSSGYIQVYADNDDAIDFILVGYWDNSPAPYKEQYLPLPNLIYDATWSDLNLKNYGISQNAVIDVLLVQKYESLHQDMGIRKIASTSQRVFDLHRAEGGGCDTVRMHTRVSPGQEIQYYHEDVSDTHQFIILGEWEIDPVIMQRPHYVEGIYNLGSISDNDFGATYHEFHLSLDTFGGIPPGAVTDIAALDYSANAIGVGLNGPTDEHWTHFTPTLGQYGCEVYQRHIKPNWAPDLGGNAFFISVNDGAGGHPTANMEVEFNILGAWYNTDFNQGDADIFKASNSGVWETYNLFDNFGIPPNSIVEILIANSGQTQGFQGGIRATNSDLQRIIHLHEAEPDNTYPEINTTDSITMTVQSDNWGQIQIYAQHNDYIHFKYMGYWTTPPAKYIETFIKFVPTESGTWTDLDVLSSGIPVKSVAEFLVSNADVSGEHNIGLRQKRYHTYNYARYINLHEAEPTPAEPDPIWNGSDWVRFQVNVNEDGIIEYFTNDPNFQQEFCIVGYWVGTTPAEDQRRLSLLHGHNAVFYHPLDDRIEYINQEEWAGQTSFIGSQQGSGCNSFASGLVCTYGSGMQLAVSTEDPDDPPGSCYTLIYPHGIDRIDNNRALISYNTENIDEHRGYVVVVSDDNGTLTSGTPLALSIGQKSYNCTYLGNNSGLIVREESISLLNISGTSLSIVDTLDVDYGGPTTDIATLTTTKAITASLLATSSGLKYNVSGIINIIEISGNTLINGDPLEFTTHIYNSIFYPWSPPQIRRLTDDQTCLFWDGNFTDTEDPPRGLIVTISGLTPTIHTPKDIVPWELGIRLNQIVPITEDKIIVFYDNVDLAGLRASLPHGNYAKVGLVHNNNIYFQSNSMVDSHCTSIRESVTKLLDTSGLIINYRKTPRMLNIVDDGELGDKIAWHNKMKYPDWPSQMFIDYITCKNVISMTPSSILSVGIKSVGTAVNPQEAIILHPGNIFETSGTDIGGYVDRSTIGATSVTYACWTKLPTTDQGKLVLERGYRFILDANSIHLNLGDNTYPYHSFKNTSIYFDQISGALTWNNTNISGLITNLNDGSGHLLITDFRYASSGEWTLRTSLDGSGWVNQGIQISGNEPVSRTNTDGRVALATTDDTSFIDEAIMWANSYLFTDEELNNLYELSNTYSEPMSQYGEIYGMPHSGQINLYVRTTEPYSSNIDLFLKVAEPINDSVPLYLQSLLNNNISLYLHTPFGDNISLFSKGFDINNNACSLYEYSAITVSGSTDLYIFSPITETLSLYSQGPLLCSSGVDLYLHPPVLHTSGINLYAQGPLPHYDDVPLSLWGFEADNNTCLLYENAMIIVSGNIDLYIISPITETILLYSQGPLLHTSGVDMYTQGLSTASGIHTLYEHGFTTTQDNISGYIGGHYPTMGACPLYTQAGHVEIWTLYLKTEDNDTDDMINLFTHGFDAISGVSQNFSNIPLYLEAADADYPYTAGGTKAWTMFLKAQSGNLTSDDAWTMFLRADFTTPATCNFYTYGHASGESPHGNEVNDSINLICSIDPDDRTRIGYTPFDSHADPWTLFLKGEPGHFGIVDLYISGAAPISSIVSCNLFIEGLFEQLTDVIPLYLMGISGVCNSGLHLFLNAGIFVYNTSGNLYVHGY